MFKRFNGVKQENRFSRSMVKMMTNRKYLFSQAGLVFLGLATFLPSIAFADILTTNPNGVFIGKDPETGNNLTIVQPLPQQNTTPQPQIPYIIPEIQIPGWQPSPPQPPYGPGPVLPPGYYPGTTPVYPPEQRPFPTPSVVLPPAGNPGYPGNQLGSQPRFSTPPSAVRPRSDTGMTIPHEASSALSSQQLFSAGRALKSDTSLIKESPRKTGGK